MAYDNPYDPDYYPDFTGGATYAPYDVSPQAQAFIAGIDERAGLEAWLNPYDLGLTIPARLTNEEAAAGATAAATADAGLPAGYMRDPFGNIVKTPSWYVPPTKEGPGTISKGPDMPSRPPAPGYQWMENIVSATGERYWVETWIGYGLGTKPPTETTPITPMTLVQAQEMVKQLDPDNRGYYIIGFDEKTGGHTVDPNPFYEQRPPVPSGGISPDVLAQIQAGKEQQKQMIAWYSQQQQAELEAQRQQRLATLRANPQSWLEYASLAGQQPAIQPWMLPLMPQQYAGTVAGAPIPGWSAGAPTMAELPELTTPSRQYEARMGPTGQQQYYGYQQARTGAPIEETQWRLWSQSPPGGQYGGLTWQR